VDLLPAPFQRFLLLDEVKERLARVWIAQRPVVDEIVVDRARLDRHPEIKSEFDLQMMKLMSEVMAHTITLHLLDASGRLQRFMRKHADLVERLPKKELASYLNLSAETLSRLKHAGKI